MEKVDYQNCHELDCIQSVNLFTPPLYKYMLFIGCPLRRGGQWSGHSNLFSLSLVIIS